MARRAPWPENELAIVRQMFPVHTDLEIGEAIHRCESNVRMMRYALGLKRDLKHLWSTDEVDTLRQLFAEGQTDEEIARAVGHTTVATRTKRSDLGLRRQRVYRRWGYAFMDRQTHPTRNGALRGASSREHPWQRAIREEVNHGKAQSKANTSAGR